MACGSRRGGPLARSCSSIDELEAKGAEQSRSFHNSPQQAVALSTIHSAKGLEWETVIMVGMEDGVLPNHNCEDIEEERRVTYVSVTRARRRLGLTYSVERYGEKLKPSPFLFEIAGREGRFCAWTGPKLKGADDRLPLLSPNEPQRRVSQGERARVSNRPNRDGKAETYMAILIVRSRECSIAASLPTLCSDRCGAADGIFNLKPGLV
jgi:hypothetical protein